nr:MAG: hypothetical protein DIU70_01850 [Bacillota bacterium]
MPQIPAEHLGLQRSLDVRVLPAVAVVVAVVVPVIPLHFISLEIDVLSQNCVDYDFGDTLLLDLVLDHATDAALGNIHPLDHVLDFESRGFERNLRTDQVLSLAESQDDGNLDALELGHLGFTSWCASTGTLCAPGNRSYS